MNYAKLVRIVSVMTSAAVIGGPLSLPASAEDFLSVAKAYVAKAQQSGAPWSGPTKGPAAAKPKTVILVSADTRNGGIQGFTDGAAQAAKVIGWNFRIIDGQGSVSGRSTALSQALALKPDAILLGGVDAAEQASLLGQIAAHGIKIIGWHSLPDPGVTKGSPIFFNVSTDAREVARAAAMEAIVDCNGTANVVLFGDSIYKISDAKLEAAAATLKQCSGCSVLSSEDTPIAEASQRMPQLTTSLLGKYGSKWTYAIGVTDLYFDYISPSLRAAGIGPGGYPRAISAGDGSVSAFERIRSGEYQIATVAEPLNEQGWQAIDEANRTISGAPPSGYISPVHLITKQNINADGGDHNVYDPANGYQDIYKKIWGVK